MRLPWKGIVHIGAVVLRHVVPAVSLVETLATQFGSLRGKDKQDAVAELVKNALEAAEGIAGKDLADDDRVDTIVRKIIDLVVELNNYVAERRGAGV